MKFRNITTDALEVRSQDLYLTVEPGETTPDLDRKQSAGFIGQAEKWAAVGEEAKAAQKKAAPESKENV